MAGFVRQKPFEQTQPSQSRKTRRTASLVCGLIVAAGLSSAFGQARLHSHNDYNRHPPLFRALRYGAESIEVDVYERRGQVCVAHAPWGVRRGRTLEKIYLDPLRRILAVNGSSVYANGKPVVLYLDFKERPEKVFPALNLILERYRPMFAVFSDTGMVREGPLHVLVEHRIDGNDIYGHAARGAGDGPGVRMAFDKHSRVKGRILPSGAPYRIYGAPDRRGYWRRQMEAGVGYLHTNRLKAARKFLDAWYAKR